MSVIIWKAAQIHEEKRGRLFFIDSEFKDRSLGLDYCKIQKNELLQFLQSGWTIVNVEEAEITVSRSKIMTEKERADAKV